MKSQPPSSLPSSLFYPGNVQSQKTKKRCLLGLFLLEYKKYHGRSSLGKAGSLPSETFLVSGPSSYRTLLKISVVLLSKRLVHFSDARYRTIYLFLRFMEECLRMYSYLLTLKIITEWFPETFNAYTLPWSFLRILTYYPSLLIKFLVPPILGMDFSLLILIYFVREVEKINKFFLRYVRGSFSTSTYV